MIGVLTNNLALYRIFRLRRRYLFTKANKLRLRYVLGCLVIFSFVCMGVIGTTNVSVAFAPVHNIASHSDSFALKPIMLTSVSAGQEGEFVEGFDDNLNHQDLVDGVTSTLMLGVEEELAHKKTGPWEEIIKINSGDTLAGALQNAGVSGVEAYKVVKALRKYYDPRSVKPGQVISIQLQNAEEQDEGPVLLGLNMKVSPIKEISVGRDELDRFEATLNQKQVVLEMKAAKATIESSLYGSAAQAGIPATVVAEMIRIYSYDVDFQRDIRQGDKVEIFYETYETEDGNFARYGDVLFANLNVGGRDIPVYRYEDDEGITDYYREDGTSIKRILMKTPIDGARMSSGFGMRRHPVLGYNKMHKGVDFAAPRGTPIYAAGSGVVTKASRFGGYGNYIKIRHKNGLETAYAHLNKYAKGVKSGSRVQQGQVIGYVGTTGRSTGPHLHFEVLQNGKQVNPKSIKSSAGQKLAGQSLKDFQSQITQIKQQYAALASGMKLAQNSVSE